MPTSRRHHRRRNIPKQSAHASNSADSSPNQIVSHPAQMDHGSNRRRCFRHGRYMYSDQPGTCDPVRTVGTVIVMEWSRKTALQVAATKSRQVLPVIDQSHPVNQHRGSHGVDVVIDPRRRADADACTLLPALAEEWWNQEELTSEKSQSGRWWV
ncbi:hypothetical protein E4U43_003757 [Claviceps pusilla]|uniref:Uncharacterized protein n=1 Tax=Claviceps pusilla TaxID=123648 RepID=A0A9P7N503_9HYPO|nr:hypothetical protein E4U43_003757 [Claviceps pusilla]